MSDTKQLAFSAAQIDAILAAAQRCSNRNLLDNWYFGNPADQRGGYVVPPGEYVWSNGAIIGTTDKYYRVERFDSSGNAVITFNGTSNCTVEGSKAVRGYTESGYTVDRWKMWIDVGTILIETDGIFLDATDNAITWSQAAESSLISAIAGKTVTMSILYTAVTDLTPDTAIMVNTRDGVVSPLRLGTNAGVTDCRSATFIFPSNATFPCWAYVAKGQKIKIHAIKLELGTVQTLAHQDENGNWVLNEIPDYGEQLARCQRYFTKIPYSIGQTISNAVSDGNGDAFFPIYFPTTMRVTPVFTHTGILRVHGPGIEYRDVSISAVATQGNIVILIVAGLNPLTTYALDSATGGVLNFSADL